jgi:hypothetical protein
LAYETELSSEIKRKAREGKLRRFDMVVKMILAQNLIYFNFNFNFNIFD